MYWICSAALRMIRSASTSAWMIPGRHVNVRVVSRRSKGKAGRTLTRGDENFRSTQYFLFMNRLAAAIRKEFPDMYLRTLAYFSTAPVPDCDLHEAIRPEFAPYVRPNDKRPIFSPENEYWLKRLQGWAQKSRHVDVYEYFALGMGFPRPLAGSQKV